MDSGLWPLPSLLGPEAVAGALDEFVGVGVTGGGAGSNSAESKHNVVTNSGYRPASKAFVNICKNRCRFALNMVFFVDQQN